MTEEKVKSLVGIFVVCSQFLVLVVVFVLYLAGGFLFEEMTTSVGLITPMLGVYVTSVIKYFQVNRFLQKKGRTLNLTYTIITLLIPVAFIAALVSVVFLKAFNIGFSSFDQFKTTLAIVQTGFGIYFGIVLTSLFSEKTRLYSEA